MVPMERKISQSTIFVLFTFIFICIANENSGDCASKFSGSRCSQDKSGLTSKQAKMIEEVKNGNVQKMEKRFGNRGTINNGDSFEANLIHVAVENGQLEMVKFLVNKGADLSLRNSVGNTPLHVAVLAQELDIVQYLAKIKDVGIDAINMIFYTPLHTAASLGNLDMVRALVENGADITLLTPRSYSAASLAKNRKFHHVFEYLTLVMASREVAPLS